LVYIQSLKNLKRLDLRGTSVSIAGVRKLKGIALNSLYLPAAMQENLADARRIFPNVSIYLEEKKTVDKEEKTLYAPLH
jgi:hypothetical protein